MTELDDWAGDAGAGEERADDNSALFAELRAAWEQVDPVPADLADRMVAAVAAVDISRDYELLTLVEAVDRAEVRSSTTELDSATLQFSDGVTSVLLHVSATADGRRRIDGWVTGDALVVRLLQGEEGWSTEPVDARFAFDDVPTGTSTLRLVVRNPSAGGGFREFMTAPFSV